MEPFDWVTNDVKFHRAIAILKKEGNTKPTEEQIKATYISIAGYVRGDLDTVKGADTSLVASREAKQEEEAPRRRSTKK